MKILAFDLGGSSIKSGIVHDDYHVTHKKKYVLVDESIRTKPQDDEIELTGIHTAEQFAKQMLSIKDSIDEEIDGIAFSYNCPVDHNTGKTYNGGATQRFLNGINFYELFRAFDDIPISVAKDGNCQLFAEVKAGSLYGHKNAITLGIGTGISCGILIGGSVFSGSTGYAGEVSYIAEDPIGLNNSLAMRCGMWGLFNRLAAIENQDPGNLNGFTSFDLVRSGKTEYREAYKDYIHELAREVFNLFCIFDPEVISIGGGIASEEMLINDVRDEVGVIAEKLFGESRTPEICQSHFISDSNLVGAAIIYKELHNIAA